MFKIRSQQNRAMITAVGIAMCILIIIIVHIAIILPGMSEIYVNGKDSSGQDPIDKTTVNEAIKLLGN